MPQITCHNTADVGTIDPENIDTIFRGLDFSYNELDIDSLSFNVLGCWNSYCSNVLKGSFADSSSQRLISKLLQSTQGDLNVRYLITAGDNHYKDPLGREVSDENSINTGFNCFNDIMNIPMFLSLGNHDVKTENIIKEQFRKTYAGREIGDANVRFNSNWILPSAYYNLKHTINGVIIDFIFVDTNLICDDYFFDEAHADDDYKATKAAEMIQWLQGKLEECNGIKCVIGHHPIFSVGHKIKKQIRREKKLEQMYGIMIKNNVHFYLCADEHNTQYLYDDDNDIHHIIAGGTGAGSGADNAYVHNDKTHAFHRPDRPIALKSDTTPDKPFTFRIRSVFTFSGPSIVNFNVTKNDVTFKVIGIDEYIIENSTNKIIEACEGGYDGEVNLANLRNNAAYNQHRVYFSKTIPRSHDLLFLLRCAAYKHKLNSTNKDEILLTLRENEVRLGESNPVFNELLEQLSTQVNDLKEQYKSIDVLRINEAGVEVGADNNPVN